MSDINFKKLREPFSRHQVKWRIGSTTKKKDKALMLAYIDARDVMERLDTVCGVENWQDTYVGYGDRVICSISIKIGDEWVTKSDGAGDTAVEADKGGISDAFKRAAVKWGVGRHLYSMKCRWMPYNEQTKKVNGDPWDYIISIGEELKATKSKEEWTAFCKEKISLMNEAKDSDSFSKIITKDEWEDIEGELKDNFHSYYDRFKEVYDEQLKRVKS